MKIEFIIPLTRGLIVSEANTSEHWSKKSARHKMQKMLINAYMNRSGVKGDEILPCIITLTRIAPRKLDYDNLVSCFKWFLDALCDNLIPGLKAGRADGDIRITKVRYDQRCGKKKEYAIEINIEKS
jgi:hypothetical protein